MSVTFSPSLFIPSISFSICKISLLLGHSFSQMFISAVAFCFNLKLFPGFCHFVSQFFLILTYSFIPFFIIFLMLLLHFAICYSFDLDFWAYLSGVFSLRREMSFHSFLSFLLQQFCMRFSVDTFWLITFEWNYFSWNFRKRHIHSSCSDFTELPYLLFGVASVLIFLYIYLDFPYLQSIVSFLLNSAFHFQQLFHSARSWP